MQKELIAKGSTGDVYKVSDGERVLALKLLDSRKSSKLIISVDTAFQKEIRALKSVTHRNIVTLIDSEQLSPSEFSITLSFCAGGSLFSLLHKRDFPGFTKKQILKVFTDILAAVTCIHGLADPLIHGDIKSLNLLLMSPIQNEMMVPWVKLGDFGSSRFMSEPPSNGVVTIGTIQWMAPEVLLGEIYGTSADIYSVGMVLYETLTRKAPFEKVPENQLMGRILKGERPEYANERVDLQGLDSVLSACWSEKPTARPTAVELSQRIIHVFLSSMALS